MSLPSEEAARDLTRRLCPMKDNRPNSRDLATSHKRTCRGDTHVISEDACVNVFRMVAVIIRMNGMGESWVAKDGKCLSKQIRHQFLQKFNTRETWMSTIASPFT